MKTITTTIFLSLGMLSAGGCAHILDTISLSSEMSEQIEFTTSSVNAINAQTQTAGVASTAKLANGSFSALTLWAANRGDNDKKAVATLMVNVSDRACFKVMDRVLTAERTTKTGLGISGKVFSGISAVMIPVDTKTILSTISTLSQSIEDEMSENILGSKDGTLIYKAVKKGRQIKRSKLITKLDASFEEFLFEFADFHDSCGVSFGLITIEESISNAVVQ